MGLSFKPEHLKRYSDFALLLWKYGRGDLLKRAGLSELLPGEPAPAGAPPAEAEALAADVERLGPTAIKLAQLLSTRPDFVPAAYAQALARLQDHCEPFPFSEVRAILAEELGVRLSKAFDALDERPLAAASIAQVHRARLRDGREVAIKVQRPGIREQVLDDLQVMGDMAALLAEHTEFGRRYGVELLFEEFRKSLLRELDFRQEAMNLLALSRNLAEIPEILVPQPILGYSTSRVLTMELVAGTKVTALSPLARLELDGERLADALFRAYLKQMLRDGMFHADPHPGNVFIADGRIALIDLGMVAHVPPALQERLLQLLLAVSDNRAGEATRTLLQVAELGEDADQAGFARGVADIIAQHEQLAVREPQLGRAVLMLLKAAADNGVRLPPELAMIGKTLLNLDEIGRTLAPHFDPNAALRRHAAEITEQQMARDFSLNALFGTAVDVKNFLQHLPERVGRILELLSDNALRVQVDAIDEARLMEGMQKVANRISLGLVLAALIVGAALMMDVPTRFTLFGYPGLAILLFLAAAAGGVALVVQILASDVSAKRASRPRRNPR
ncbi:MAG TPA: AarF/UbiB family protein [Burkholderiales bacterium]|nr:AarF/UbiB family protein [Burkholderiales bacterium]